MSTKPNNERNEIKATKVQDDLFTFQNPVINPVLVSTLK